MRMVNLVAKGINEYLNDKEKASKIAFDLVNTDFDLNKYKNMNEFGYIILGILPLLNDTNTFIESVINIKLIYPSIKRFTNGKTLIILCGPSASGKDTIACLARQQLLLKNINLSFIRKYTTRPKRNSSSSVPFCNGLEPSSKYIHFDRKVEMEDFSNDASLGYFIDGHYYAFSGKHLLSDDSCDKNLLGIFGRFENIVDLRKIIFDKYKRLPISILIRASTKDLESRILQRDILDKASLCNKLTDMKNQCTHLNNNKHLNKFHYDLVINNSDNQSLHQNINCFSAFLYRLFNIVN